MLGRDSTESTMFSSTEDASVICDNGNSAHKSADPVLKPKSSRKAAYLCLLRLYAFHDESQQWNHDRIQTILRDLDNKKEDHPSNEHMTATCRRQYPSKGSESHRDGEHFSTYRSNTMPPTTERYPTLLSTKGPCYQRQSTFHPAKVNSYRCFPPNPVKSNKYASIRTSRRQEEDAPTGKLPALVSLNFGKGAYNQLKYAKPPKSDRSEKQKARPVAFLKLGGTVNPSGLLCTERKVLLPRMTPYVLDENTLMKHRPWYPNLRVAPNTPVSFVGGHSLS